MPQLSESEWQLLRKGLTQLSNAQRTRFEQALHALGTQPARPVTCPLLDRATQACMVYAYRPVACRTYGFYSERILGLYCNLIETAVERGDYADVIWGNHEAIDRTLTRHGPKRPLHEWFAREAADA